MKIFLLFHYKVPLTKQIVCNRRKKIRRSIRLQLNAHFSQNWKLFFDLWYYYAYSYDDWLLFPSSFMSISKISRIWNYLHLLDLRIESEDFLKILANWEFIRWVSVPEIWRSSGKFPCRIIISPSWVICNSTREITDAFTVFHVCNWYIFTQWKERFLC